MAVEKTAVGLVMK